MTKLITPRRHPLTRAAIALARDPMTAAQFAKSTWPDDRGVVETIERGAVVITSADSNLAQNAVLKLISILGPLSAFYKITKGAMNVELGRNVTVLVPAITASSSGVTFVAAGAPIPAKQLATSAVAVGNKKIAVIVGLNREIVNYSKPNAETMVTAALNENIGAAMDSILLDTTAADSTRPAGLRWNIAATTATALSATVFQPDAMTKDLTNLAAAVAPVAGSLENIAFIASPGEAIKIAMRSNAVFPFNVFASSGLASGVVVCVALNGLVVAADPEARYSISDQGLIHYEDSTPAPISTSPGVYASPVRSEFQTDGVAIRLVLNVNWALRAAGAVAWTQSVTW